MCAIIKDLKDAGWRPVRKQVDLRMTENRHWLNRVVTPATVTAPGVASLLEQTDTSPGTWHAATALANVFSSISVSMRLSRSQMPSSGGKALHTCTVLPQG